MKEFKFTQTRSEGWIKIENALNKKEKLSPDELADYYVSLSDDYSYAQTYFPKSNIKSYLANLMSRVHVLIYKNKKQETSILSFWRYSYPKIVFESRRTILFSLAILIVGFAVGWFSNFQDPDFKRLIMGDYYIDITLNNIEKGDPLAIYKSGIGTTSFLGITINNIKVSFMAFVTGISFGVLTVAVVFSNAVMLGTFMAMFEEHDLLSEAISVVFIHGTLEIFAIVIAGAAGFIVGRSLLFPQTYTRMASFKQGVQKAGRLCMGLIPIFITAGFLEGYVTRYTTMPYAVRYAIIGASLLFIVYYFFIYPARIHRNKFQTK